MAEQPKSSGLQVEDDRPWQETLWTTQRVAWAVMAIFAAAALIGLTGNGGPLASASAAVAGARIDYPQVTRWDMDDKLTVRLPESASGKVEIEMSRSFGELFDLRSVVPEPAEVAATASGYRFTFNAGGRGEKVVAFTVRASEPAFRRTVHVRLADSPPTALRVTVLP